MSNSHPFNTLIFFSNKLGNWGLLYKEKYIYCKQNICAANIQILGWDECPLTNVILLIKQPRLMVVWLFYIIYIFTQKKNEDPNNFFLCLTSKKIIHIDKNYATMWIWMNTIWFHETHNNLQQCSSKSNIQLQILAPTT